MGIHAPTLRRMNHHHHHHHESSQTSSGVFLLFSTATVLLFTALCSVEGAFLKNAAVLKLQQCDDNH